MTNIMNKTAIVAVPSTGALKLCTVTLNGSTSGFENAYVVSVRAVESADVQYDKALDSSILFTVFGDQMVLLVIRVLQPSDESCSTDQTQTSIDTLYNQYKISSKNRSVVKIAIDKAVYVGYMVNKESTPQQAGNGSAAGFMYDIKIVGVRT